MTSSSPILSRLFNKIATQWSADPKVSYTAKLRQQGVKKIRQKVGEEAMEFYAAYNDRDKNDLVSEAADIIYHLAVLLHARELNSEIVISNTFLKKRHIDTYSNVDFLLKAARVIDLATEPKNENLRAAAVLMIEGMVDGLHNMGIDPNDVVAKLAEREAQSGLAEKASRGLPPPAPGK